MKRTELTKMDNWKLIPSIEQAGFRSFEYPALVGAGPLNGGYRVNGYQCRHSYTMLAVGVIYLRVVPDGAGTLAIQSSHVRKQQRWDMGGCYLGPLEVWSSENGNV